MCESFGCTPDVANELNPQLVFAVLDYRLAESAKTMLNSKQADKMSEGQARMLTVLSELVRDG